MNTQTLATHRRSHLLILALIVGFAAALRIFALSSLGYWTDELCTLSAANGWGLQLDHVPVNQIAPTLAVCTRLGQARSIALVPGAMAREDAHPPLYFLLLRVWEQILGDGETAVRSLNVLLSLLAIVLLYFVAAASVGSATALVASLLMSVATPQIQYSQEARNYMPVLVLLLLAAMALQRLRKTPSAIWAWLLGTSLLAMMLTHYFAAGAAAGLVGYAMLAYRNRSRSLVLRSSIIAAIIFLLLWGRSLIQQREVMQNGLGWLSDDAPGHLQRRLLDLCRLPVRYFAEITEPRWQFCIATVGALMLLALPMLWIGRRELRIWIAWFTGSVALVVIADLSRSTTQLNWVRYTLFATPAACVLLAAAIPKGRARFVLPGVAVVLAILTLRTAYIPPWKKDFRTPIEVIENRLKSDDGLVILGSDPIQDGIMFAAFAHYLPRMPVASAVLTKPPSPMVLARLQLCPQVWVIQLWPQKFTMWPGFKVAERQTVPYFGEILRCRPDPGNHDVSHGADGAVEVAAPVSLK